MKDNFDLHQHTLTRPDSPKVIRERKSNDFGVRSPRPSRRDRDDSNLQKVIHENNNWASRYLIEDQDYAKGAYGKVILARDRTSLERVVIKKIPQSTPSRMIINEVKAGKVLPAHDNIPLMHQYVEKSDFHYIVFQFVEGIDLFVYLEKLNFSPRPDMEARAIISQVLDALQHCHSYNIAHRDIKLENILMDSKGKIYVIDLGLCAFMEEKKPCRDFCGSDNYLAPEIVRRTPYCGYKADVFSTGVVLFSLLFGVFPFENLRVNGVHSTDPNRPLKTLRVRFPADVPVASSAKDLLARMLEDDPAKRISMDEVINHPWMQVGKAPSSPDVFSLRNSCESKPFKSAP